MVDTATTKCDYIHKKNKEVTATQTAVIWQPYASLKTATTTKSWRGYLEVEHKRLFSRWLPIFEQANKKRVTEKGLQ